MNMKKLLFAIIAACCIAPSILPQTTPTPLYVVRIFNVSSVWAGECATDVIDNRSQYTRQSDYHSYLATGTGTWTVTLQYSDTSCAGPFTSFGSAGVITQASNPAIGYGNGYHPFIKLSFSGANASTVRLTYTAWKQAYVSTSVGSLTFPLTIPQGGTNGTTVIDAKANLDIVPPVASDYSFTAQAPGGSLIAGGVNQAVTLTPCPVGVAGADTAHYIYITGGTGSAEAVAITGGTCTSGASSGTITITPANNHSGAWTVVSATNGIQEAICSRSSAGGQVNVASDTTLLANVSTCGKTTVEVEKFSGVTISGAFKVIGGSFVNITGSARMLINGVALFNVKAYGAKGDAVFGGVGTDDTTAIQNAINAARTAVGTNLPGGGIIFFPRGGYMISNLDMTNIAANYGIVVQGSGPGATIIYAKAGTSSYGTSTGHLFDLTGSSGLTFKDLQVGGDAVGPVPTTAFFMAPSNTLTTNVIEFGNILVTGRYSAATMYNFGMVSSDSRKMILYNYKTGVSYTMYTTSTNALSLASAYTTVYASSSGVSNLTFFDCEFHHFGDSSGFPIKSNGTSNVLFVGGNISSNNSQAAYYVLDTETSYIGFHSVAFYSDLGPAPANAFNVISGASTDGFDVRGSRFQTLSGFVGGAGVIIGGSAASPGPSGHSTVGTAVSAGSTVYMNTAGHDATIANIYQPLGARAIVSGAYCTSSVSPGSGQTFTFTLMQGSSTATAVTMTISDSATSASDVTHYATIGQSSPGEPWAWRAVASGGATSARLACTSSMILW